MKPHKSNVLFVVVLTVLWLGLGFKGNAQTLTHRYSFQDAAGSSTFADSAGSVPGTLVNGGTLTGSSLVLDGQGDFGLLGNGGILNGYSQVTVEFWVDVDADNMPWTRIFSFGWDNNGAKDSGIDYSPYAPGGYQNLDYASTNGADVYANNSQSLLGETNAHVTVVVDPTDNAAYYYNGTQVVSFQHNTLFPMSEINDVNDVLGRSLDDIDPTLAGTYHEFRIYQGVLPASQIALNDASGPSNILSSPGTVLSLSFSNPVDPITINQSVPQVLAGNFTSVSNLNLIAYGGVTYTSGNTSILTVSSSGVIKGVAVGTTTVTAQYGSISATNTVTVVSLPTTLIHRYSFTSDASDSIGGANGTYVGDATNSGGQLVLDGGGYLNLPAAQINIATNAAVTFEAWTTIGETAEWSHLFEFGNIKNHNIYCAPRADAAGFHEFGISEDGSISGAQTLIWAHGWSNISFHITAVVDPTTSTMAVYTNGVLMQASYTAAAPLSSLGTANATLGNSSYGDPNATLNVDEFRIYSGALTPAQVAMSDQSGPNNPTFDPGTLNSISVPATNYPAFAANLAPVVLAHYANLASFNLLANVLSVENGLSVTSSDPNIISVNAENMLTTHRPGTVTLSATYLGKTASGTVRVANQAALVNRYSFTSNASDSVSGANGTLVGTASISGGQVQLDGGSGDYVSLPSNLITSYRSATMDIWATISSSQQLWSRLWEFADVSAALGASGANEVYFAPYWGGGGDFMNDGVVTGGGNTGTGTALINQTVHLTCLLGDGTLDLYTNGEPYLSVGVLAPASQAGGSDWIGYSPYGDPGITGSVDEYRIYQGRLSPEEILASQILGPNQTLSLNASLSVVTNGANVVLIWPVANAGFAVEESINLSSSAAWVTLTNAPTLVGNTQWQLTVPGAPTAQFFRLIR